jgi:hypothetical protein
LLGDKTQWSVSLKFSVYGAQCSTVTSIPKLLELEHVEHKHSPMSSREVQKFKLNYKEKVLFIELLCAVISRNGVNSQNFVTSRVS